MQALAGPRIGNRYLAHVGGAGRLMELQGPEKYRDSFAKEILRFNRGGIVSSEGLPRCSRTRHVQVNSTARRRKERTSLGP
jgi:hypothetical protein